MLDIKCIPTGQLEVNTYILTDSGEAAVIDPGGDCDSIIEAAKAQGAVINKILLTHGHFDHYSGAAELKRKTGAPLYIHQADEPMLSDNKKNLSFLTYVPPESVEADEYLNDGDEIAVGESILHVFHTPGHSSGSVSLYCDGVLFGGDLLFYGSIGRFDHGDIRIELNSLKFLMDNFADDTVVYPGHGCSTTIGQERMHNPYIINHIN